MVQKGTGPSGRFLFRSNGSIVQGMRNVMKKKSLIRRIYDLGSFAEIIAERTIAALVRKLRKK